MKPAGYDNYLRSEHWQQVREDALSRARRRCQVCNSPDELHVHHRTYERLGFERAGDVTVLCRGCHKLFHEQEARTGRMRKLSEVLRDEGYLPEDVA
jgi:5-methylcytosine-specific restriction endonuclease McrA